MHLSRLFVRSAGIVTVLVLAGCASVPETFVASRGAVWVVRGDAAATPLPRVPADASWTSLGYEANNRYLLGWQPEQRALLVLNAGSGGRIKTVPVVLPDGFVPGPASAVRWRGRHVWIASADGAALAVVQLDTGRTLRTLVPPGTGPVAALAYDRTADAVWLLRADGRTLDRVAHGGGALPGRVAPVDVRALAVVGDAGALLLLTDAGLLRWAEGEPRPEPWPPGLPAPGAVEFLDHGPNAPVRVF